MIKKEKTNIIIQSFLLKIVSDEWSELDIDALRHICQYVDFNKVPDRVVADNEYLHDMIPWERIDKMKVIRVLARNIKIAYFVDLSKYSYTVKETRNMLRIHPHLIDKLCIDLNKINSEDAFSLLTLGNEELSCKISVERYSFTAKEIYEIIKCNSFSEQIIKRFDLSVLKDYHVCDMIINTGDLYFDILDLKKLTAKKWVEILQTRRELFNYCDFSKFIEGDIYHTVELINLFPEDVFLDTLIEGRNYNHELSALGLEKLLISKPDKYIKICNLDKLNEVNWKNLINKHQFLSSYKKL